MSGLCDGNGVCLDSCADGSKDGHETDLDCGGICATKCGLGKRCLVDGDCATGTCGLPDAGAPADGGPVDAGVTATTPVCL